MASILAEAPIATDQRYVYRFGGGVSDGGRGDRNLLGGKGANLAEMASIGLPVPPGFTISTEMCARYYDEGGQFPQSLRDEVAEGIAHIEGVTGKTFGDKADPLLVSVRSGARASMPGMMDTVLNLGLNDATVEGLAATSGDARFAWTAIAASSRCIRMWCSNSIMARSRKRWKLPRRITAISSTPI
jgi:pyruvate,orthophosphate dikinase